MLNDPTLGLSDKGLNCLHNSPHRLPCDTIDDDIQMTIKLYLGNSLEATCKAPKGLRLNLSNLVDFSGTELCAGYKALVTAQWYLAKEPLGYLNS